MSLNQLKDWLEYPEASEFERVLNENISKAMLNLRGQTDFTNYRFADGFISGMESVLELISSIKRSEFESD